jgi:hypothetical protein
MNSRHPGTPEAGDAPEFSRREILSARIFCAVVGAVAMAGGCAAYYLASGAASKAGLVFALVGAGLVVFAFTAPDRECVKLAGTVLSLF